MREETSGIVGRPDADCDLEKFTKGWMPKVQAWNANLSGKKTDDTAVIMSICHYTYFVVD